jgi:hypothetical protein
MLSLTNCALHDTHCLALTGSGSWWHYYDAAGLALPCAKQLEQTDAIKAYHSVHTATHLGACGCWDGLSVQQLFKLVALLSSLSPAY